MPAEATLTEFPHPLTDRGEPSPEADVAAVFRLVAARRPAATSLLEASEVAGTYLTQLGRRFEHVEVVTTSAAAGTAAHRALPSAAIHETAVADLDLPRRFDVATALGTALATLPLSGLAAAVAVLARHLNPGGLLLIEPFWLPDHATRRSTDARIGRDDQGRTVSAVYQGAPRDGGHVVQRHALIADQDGVRHVSDTRTLYAFGHADYATVLAAAGCGMDFLPTGLAGRPLVVGVRR
ncbi:hypothetical protein [Actinoplanes sp. NPDC049599]|uniref:hypothetical protein n=1 Tax=Actinoplanes sp. NPDC049599 TaxID=3363903 RepID=UPI0037A4D467